MKKGYKKLPTTKSELKRVADNDQDEKVDLIMKSIVPTYVRREEAVV